jgi:hypothetical protein
MEPITDIYTEALAKMRHDDIDHWASDLLLKVTDVSRALVDNYNWKCNVQTFNSAIDGSLWFDLPFAYHGEPELENSQQYLERVLNED